MSLKKLRSGKSFREDGIAASIEKDGQESFTQGQSRATKGGRCGLLILSIDLLSDILSRLPIDDVLSCRCVCKTFLNILTESCFLDIYHHTKAANTDRRLIIQDTTCASNMFLVRLLDLGKPSFSDCGNNNHDDCDSHPSLKLTVPSFVSDCKSSAMVSIVGSCNGLVCLSHLWKGFIDFYICNPILGEFLLIPRRRYSCRDQPAGFGFCPKTQKYKLIRFVDKSFCEIYTVGDHCWRKIENVPFPKYFKSFDTSFNGKLHWVTDSSSLAESICSLDLETEQFEYVPLAGRLNQGKFNRLCCTGIGTLGGLFALYYLIDRIDFEVWVQKDYGVKDSWFKVKTFGLTRRVERFNAYPFRLLDDGTLLISCRDGPLISYSLEKGAIAWVVAGVHRAYDVIAHVPSFISLKDITGYDKLCGVERKRLGCFWSGIK